MPEETTESTQAQTTTDESVKNTGAESTGAATQAATTEAQTEKTFTQADVDRIVANRIKSGVKAELKKLTGENDGTPTVEELQRKLSETTERARAYEAKEAVRDYIGDPKNKLNVKTENLRAIEKLVLADIEYDDDGKPANLKEAFESVKSLAPALFTNGQANINGSNGRNATVENNDMNAFIRQQHAGRN